MKVCQICGAKLHWAIGWTHPGGSLYVARCDKCGYKTDEYPTPHKCPACGGEMRDDHIARPVDV